jgi:hypothetical protein
VYAARQLGQGRSVRLPVSDTPSEMTEVYRAFNQMAEDVEQAGRERELMLAGVSHDLRTPLTRLRLSLELMGDHTDLTDDMVRDIEDMDAILDQFLAFIRDGRDEKVEEVDLCELIREVVALGGEHDDRYLVVRRTQAAASGQAIFAGKHQVEHDQVEHFACQQAVHLFGVGHGARTVTLAGEKTFQEAAEPWVVIHDEDFLAFRVLCCAAHCVAPFITARIMAQTHLKLCLEHC